jgi:hypothetical protein
MINVTDQDSPIIRREKIKWIATFRWDRSIAVTLTCREGILVDGLWLRGNHERYSRNLRHVLNVLNGKLFGNAGKWRKGRSPRLYLQIVAIMETDTSGRLHYHLRVGVPEGMTYLEVWEPLRDAWIGSPWGYNEVHCKMVTDSGWDAYMFKKQFQPYSKFYFDVENIQQVDNAV